MLIGSVRNHRPNPSRAANVFGSLDMNAAKRLTSKIKSFGQQSNRAITIYICSSGGRVDAFYVLDALLNSNNSVSKQPNIITVARQASSAAAYLLVAGHFAYAAKNAQLHFHGVRTRDHRKVKILTWENALAMASRLDQENKKVARIMAMKVMFRLAARHRRLRQNGGLRVHRLKTETHFDDFRNALGAHLTSNKSRKLLIGSIKRFKLIFSIAQSLPSKKLTDSNRNSAELDAKLFKAIITPESKGNHPNERIINSKVMGEFMTNYLLASDLMHSDRSPAIHKLVELFGKDFLTDSESLHYAKLKKGDSQKAQAYLLEKALPSSLGLACLALTLCNQLLLGAHSLSAMDAYWLGLVDEVIDETQSMYKIGRTTTK